MDIKFDLFELSAMNLQELRTFLTIIDTGSLVKASHVLNVTQSTVTARLKSLEDEIGQTLLLRHKSGATLTAAGQRLQRYAETISNLWQQARQDVALPSAMSGVCNLACDHDLWANLGQTFMDHLTRRFPDIGMSIWLGSGAEVARWMDEGKSDIAFTYRAATTARQGQIAVPPDRLILVSTSPDSPIRFDPDYVFVEAGEAFGRDHALAYADAGTARLSFGNAQTAKDHILRVGGSAYLPERLVLAELAERRLFRLTDAPTFARDIFLTFNTAERARWDWFEDVVSAVLK